MVAKDLIFESQNELSKVLKRIPKASPKFIKTIALFFVELIVFENKLGKWFKKMGYF